MLVVIPYFTGDQAMALKLSKWMLELGGCKGHKVLIARDYRTNAAVDTEIRNVLSKTFDSVETLTIKGDVWNTWRISPQHMFKETARYIEYKIKEPWFWFEVDAVPLCKGWLDIIHKEYYTGDFRQKPFWGAFVPGIHGAPDHLSGVAAYPGELVEHAGNYYFAHDTPFDLMGADQAVPKARFSDRVQHRWQRTWVNDGEVKANNEPPFKDYEDFRANVTTEAVIFHADKTLSLIDILRPVLFPPNGKPDSSDNNAQRDQCFVPLSEPKEGTVNNGFVWKNGAWHIMTNFVTSPPNALAGLGTSQMGVEHNVPPAVKASKVKDSLPSGRNERAGSAVDAAAGTQVFPSMEEVKRAANVLVRYSEQNGFARMRVLKVLKQAKLVSKRNGKSKR